MLPLEYRIGLHVLAEEIGFLNTVRIVLSALIRSLTVRCAAGCDAGEAERTKARLKNHFKLLASMYRQLKRRHGSNRANEVIRRVLMEGGKAFFRGFRPLRSDEALRDFAGIYKKFEKNNIVFDVIEESENRFEIAVRRCLVFEAFKELGASALSQWMCDIGFEYFSGYHPRMKYEKDRMIARGDSACHEVFTWE